MAIGKVFCANCGVEFNGSSNAVFCSSKCKQKKYRQSKLTSGIIYRLKRGGVIVYVGQTNSEIGLKRRLSSHIYGEYPKIFDDHDFYLVKGSSLNEAETDEIIKHKPIYNRALPPNEKYMTVKNFSKKISVFIEDVVMTSCDSHSLSDGEQVYSSYIKKSDFEGFKKRFLDALKNIKDD